MTRLRVAVEDRFLRSHSGAIWGSVCFEVDDHFFPDIGWTELVAAFLVAWLEALSRLGRKGTRKEPVWFMDGRFALGLSSSGADDVIQIKFVHKGAIKKTTEDRVRDLMENAIVSSELVLVSCRDRGWHGKDVTDLELIAKQARTLSHTLGYDTL